MAEVDPCDRRGVAARVDRGSLPRAPPWPRARGQGYPGAPAVSEVGQSRGCTERPRPVSQERGGMTRDTFDMFAKPDRGRFGENECGNDAVTGNDSVRSNLCDIDVVIHAGTASALLISPD